MSSFLSRRLNEQAQKTEAQGGSGSALQDLSLDDEVDDSDVLSLLEDEASPESRLLKKQAAKKAPEPEVAADLSKKAPPKQRTTPEVAALRKKFRAKLLARPDEADHWQRGDAEHEKTILDRLKTIISKSGANLSQHQLKELQEGLLNDILGFAAIEPLVQDKRYSEIMVNGPRQVYAEFNGKLTETEIVFDDEEHLQWAAQRIVRPLQRPFDRANPMVDARLPDGSRVHLIMPPSALNGTTITIRKFPDKPLTVADLISFGSFTQNVADFLEACIVARLNTVVSGGTGSGKTTLLNVLSSFIPNNERIITVEDSAELQLTQSHVVSLETTAPIPGGDGHEGKLEIRDLVKGTLRMRPDRIVVGECRSGEALDMLQAMNTGHDGSLTTVHSNSPRDSIGRLETLCMMAGMDLPVDVIRRQIASAVDLIVQQARLKDGSRKIIQVTELQGMEGEQVTLQDIFVYKTPDHKGMGPSHSGGGELEPSGFRPNFSDRLKEAGFKLGAGMFNPKGPGRS